jgi:hypothetical protein
MRGWCHRLSGNPRAKLLILWRSQAEAGATILLNPATWVSDSIQFVNLTMVSTYSVKKVWKVWKVWNFVDFCRLSMPPPMAIPAARKDTSDAFTGLYNLSCQTGAFSG